MSEQNDTARASSGDAVAAALEAVKELRAALDAAEGTAEDLAQARAAAQTIEHELNSVRPEREEVGQALKKLQNLVLKVGAIAGAVNAVDTALSGIHVH